MGEGEGDGSGRSEDNPRVSSAVAGGAFRLSHRERASSTVLKLAVLLTLLLLLVRLQLLWPLLLRLEAPSVFDEVIKSKLGKVIVP